LNGGVEHCIHYLMNNVDISNFNPGAAPPMTEFLRNIREASKSPAQQTIEALIHARVGVFGSDLVTSREIVTTIRAASIMHEDMIFCDANWFTPNRVGKVLGDITTCTQVKGKIDGRNVRLWAIRNTDLYTPMQQSLVLLEYDKQIEKCKTVLNKRVNIVQ